LSNKRISSNLKNNSNSSNGTVRAAFKVPPKKVALFNDEPAPKLYEVPVNELY